MNKKGFTLIEIIISLGLLGLMGILIAANTTGLFANEQDKEYEQFLSIIENAACAYLDLSTTDAKNKKNQCLNSGSTSISISTLVGQGLLTEKDLVKPTNNAYVSSSQVVNVSCSDGVKTCTFNP